MKITSKITILGDGGWGTTLAIHLAKEKFDVVLWSAFKDYALQLNKERVNSKFLPGVKIPRDICITYDLKNALSDCDIAVLAIPSEYMRCVLKKVRAAGFPRKAAFLSVTKGIEKNSLKRMSEVICEELGRVKLAVLSGPTIAHEVAAGLPTAAVIASRDKNIRKFLQDIFMTDRFRIYTNSDVIGVELGGSLKNVIAIACGISDGLGFGANTKSALLARGLAEIAKLGKAMGARTATFSGISGLGDLVTTCISSYSRNRFVGEQIGKGRTLEEIKSHMQMVAEGIPTAASAYALAKRYSLEMPIISEVYAVVYKNKSPKQAVRDLMTRTKKEE